MLQAQKQKKCPPGYRFDKKLQVCVPTGVSRYYPYLGGVRNNTDSSNGYNNNNYHYFSHCKTFLLSLFEIHD